MFEALETFTPKAPRRETLPDLFRNIRKEQQLGDKDAADKNNPDKKRPVESLGGFITAKQHAECKKIKLDLDQGTGKSEVITDEGGKQEAVVTDEGGITSEGADNMEEKNKEQKLKMLFGDESEGEGEQKKKAGSDKKQEEGDKKRDYKHSKRKHEDRKRKGENDKEEVSDKRKCTNETKPNGETERSLENGASSSVVRREEKAAVDSSARTESSGKSKAVKLKKAEIGTLVVKLLTPAYAERRFESRDAFKNTARTISHALINKSETASKSW